MKVVGRINTNAAMALDGNGKEIVILGKGVGFPKVPYELTDLSQIQRTFYEVDSRFLGLLENLPEQVLLASAEIYEQAEMELECRLNPNLPFTLADHLAFAVEREQQGLQLSTPLSYDVQHLYPQELQLGRFALDIMQKYTGVRLPECEAVSVALHLINAELEHGDLKDLSSMMKIIGDVTGIIESQLGITIDTQNYYYFRFNLHLRYLIQSLSAPRQEDRGIGRMLAPLAAEYPKAYRCTRAIADYFARVWGWKCTEEELLYLMLHVGKFQENI